LNLLFQTTIQHLLESLSGCKWLFSLFITGFACYINYFTSGSLWNVTGGFAVSTAWFTFLFAGFFTAGYLVSTGMNAVAYVGKAELLILLLGPLLFALKITLPYHTMLHVSGIDILNKRGNAAGWLGGFLWTCCVVALLHRLYEQKWGLYWVSKRPRLLPYLLMLLLMAPLVVAASASSSFSTMYPRVQELSRYTTSVISWGEVLLYEVCYLVDFLSIEFFFRGFLVAVLSRILGTQALLPVAFFYFSIHLGKPMPEAIGSFFGALVLGSVALQTKSVWGGWVVHAGIALLMELLSAFF
jgi:hypothetical protein